MGTFRLWSDEIEAMRPEALAVIEAGRSSMMLDAQPSGDLSFEERIAAARESMAVVTFTLPDTEERKIAGVDCRVRHAEGAPRAVYLHFHGGGMISGSAGVMDIPNQMLSKEHEVTVVSVEYRKAPEYPLPGGPRRRGRGCARARRRLGRGARLRPLADRRRVGRWLHGRCGGVAHS